MTIRGCWHARANIYYFATYCDAVLRPSINFYYQYWVLRCHRQMFPILKKGAPQINHKSATVQPIFGNIREFAVIYQMEVAEM